ncbi:DUF4143 domain-containing protein [Haloechinothrix sp. LS1_15]|uniref:ATP-binding protein n=1 Tax=Haloechinothrix sp. LS1_15 TaxID=2652248 RepID=UPI0029474501|nr:DUF4143 domain-containing protein [Haloechinothrix sp. LS1_15]MDV6012285.1 ATP-binding protein [Haloechinothrix sp. LS1_15]
MSTQSYYTRLVDPYLAEIRRTFPAVLLTGARATGKTTTARQHVETVIRLDRYEEAGAFQAAPDRALATMRGSVLLDEWQEVPEVLGAVKRAVDEGAEPGRFLLAGSVRAPMKTTMWPGTGRLIQVSMYPMTTAELKPDGVGTAGKVLDLLSTGRAGELLPPADPPDLVGYLELAVAGGYPEVVRAPGRARTLWLTSYLEQVFTRDTAALGEHPDSGRLRRFVEVLAANTAGLIADTDLARLAGLNVKTVKHYQHLLVELGLLDSVPAWFANRNTRFAKGHKYYFIDPGLAAALIGVDVVALLRDTDMMGRMLDTFVAAQIRPLLELREDGARLHHLRMRDGRHEVDQIVEFRNGRLLAIEVKASAGPSTTDARHLAWMRDQFGEHFVGGIVFHTGKWVYPLGERITAVPIAALWDQRWDG